jgi:Cu-processing system permease protein
MTNRIGTIARYTMLEAMRTRFPVLALGVIVITLAASCFVREIAIIESARFQTAFYAATMRFAAVFVVALYAIAAVTREFHDKGLDIALALDLPRSHYITGKLLGLVAVASAFAMGTAVPLLALAGIEPAAQWTIALACELVIVVAASLFCAITFTTLMPAASCVMAFYLLARVLSAIRLIGANPVSGTEALPHHLLSGIVEGLAWIVPAFDRWTRTSWLVDEPASWTTIASLTGQSVVFVIVVTAAAVFDMHRKSL